MKKLNVLLSIALILLLGFVAFFFIGGTLRSAVSVATASASDYPEVCTSIQSIVDSGAAAQKFSDLPESMDGCTLIDMTISLSNYGLFDAEWIDVSVSPASGDLAVYSLTGESSSLPSRTMGAVNLKLISSAPADTTRPITLSYYVLGMKRSITVYA